MVQTAVLGPWSGGLNLTSNRDLSVFLKPNELGEATNVIYSKEGFVQPRPGCKVVLDKGGLYSNATGNYRFDILGSIKLSTGAQVVLVQIRNATGTYIYKVTDRDTISLYWSTSASVWFNHVIIHEGGIGTPTAGQPELGHKGIIFFAEQDNNCYITDDFTLTTIPRLVPAGRKVPGSSGGMIVKNRLFLWKNATSKFMWSPANYILDFTGVPDGTGVDTTGIDVSNFEFIEPTSAHDGIMSVQYLNNNFYIFKKTKTFMFTYQTLPLEDAYLRKINTEMGALAATMYRNQVVVLNSRGVFRIDVTEFIDMQAQLNLRFEVPLDHTAFTTDDVFVTDFNNDILIGFQYTDINAVKSYYYFNMNGYTGAWSRWTYDYNSDETPTPTRIASPGSRQFRSQGSNAINQSMFFTTFDHKFLVAMDWKPREGVTNVGHYHSDTNTENLLAWDRYYIPAVTIKTKAALGGSDIRYKKIFRTYVRLYISDIPATIEQYPGGVWTFSINYNDYRFGVDTSHETEQILLLYPTSNSLPIMPQTTAVVSTAVYQRTYQLPIHQFRALEFVFEFRRKWTSTTDTLTNPDVDEPSKPVKRGYWFSLAGVYYDYDDRASL